MRALITGITGQDGSYLAELLLEKGYEVFGLVHRSCPPEFDCSKPMVSRVRFVQGDLTDQVSLDAAVQRTQPEELYNLAAQSFAAGSWDQPIETAEVTGMGALRALEAIRKYSPRTRFLQASSSEMFSKADEGLINEKTPLRPRNPYGAAKTFAHHATVNYRERFGFYACSCICFNHESPRRGPQFVTRKITQHAAATKMGVNHRLRLGNLDAQRDWGYAGDYVRAMWLMLQQPVADDYMLATGETHSVRDILDIAFSYLGLDWEKYVEVDPGLVRGGHNDNLRGNAGKARRELDWKPETDFRQLIEMMVNADLATLRKEFPAHAAAAGA